MLPLEKQNHLREQYRQQHPNWQPATELYAGMVRRQLSPESRLLDLGCGRGGLVEQLAHPLSQTAGIDPDWLSLHEHRLPLPRAQALSSSLPFADAFFDLVFASWLLEHLPHPETDFREVGRVLRPDGYFIFITPNRQHPLALLNRFLGRLGRWQGWLVERLYGRAAEDTFPTYYRANSIADLRQLAHRSQMQPVTLKAIPDPTYLAFRPFLFRLMQGVDNRVPAERQLHLVGCFKKV